MLGFAQKLFLERGGPNFWGEPQKGSILQLLPYVDYLLAERLLMPIGHTSENAAAFLCYLSMASRQGNLCIRKKDSQLFPEPISLWKQFCEEEPNHPIEGQIFAKMALKGVDELPSTLITQVDRMQQKVWTPLCQWRNLIYFQRNWFYESYFLEQMQRLETSSPSISLDLQKIQEQVHSLEKQGLLLPEQAQAIVTSSQKTISLICGGPGTGKTYTAALLLRIFWEVMSPSQREKCRIVLAAPTGKAAANLQLSFNKMHKPLVANTLHALLGLQPSKPKQLKKLAKLDADIVLVDESSMIDLQLMVHLFASMKEGSRIILLGDADQIPSVEAGSLFADLLHVYSNKESPIGKLRTCMRAEQAGLIQFSQTLLKGDANLAIHYLNEGISGVKRALIPFNQEEIYKTQHQIIQYASDCFPTIENIEMSTQNFMEYSRKFCLLSPLRRGPFGADELNQLIHQHRVRSGKNQPLVSPILVKRNNKQLGLFNGDLGYLVQSKGKEDYFLFPQPGSNEMRKLSVHLVASYEYAYCLSVHKSQGSEFSHVLLLMPKGSEVFGREILYTAATRARKQLEIWSDDQILRETLTKQSLRISGIQERSTDFLSK